MAIKNWQLKLAWCAWIIFGALLAFKIYKFGGVERSLYPLLIDSGRHWLANINIHYGTTHSFQYWPGFAVLFVPFNFLPDLAGSLLWSGLCFFLYIFAAHKFSRTFFSGWQRGIFILALLPIAYEGLMNQQSNPLFAALIMLGLVNIKHRNWWLASFCFIFPGIVKIAPLCFGLLVLACFPRKLWWRYLIMLAWFIAFPFGYNHFAYVLQQYKNWLDILSHEDGQRWAYRDAWVLWELFVFGWVSNSERSYSDMFYYRLLQLAMAGLAFILTFYRCHVSKLRPNQVCLQIMMWGAWWLLLFGPSTEVATCVMGAAGYSAGVVISFRLKRLRILMLISYALVALGSSGDLEYELGYSLDSDWHKAMLSVGGILFGLWLIFYNLRLRKNLEEK